jgi:hypothetical protein
VQHRNKSIPPTEPESAQQRSTKRQFEERDDEKNNNNKIKIKIKTFFAAGSANFESRVRTKKTSGEKKGNCNTLTTK